MYEAQKADVQYQEDECGSPGGGDGYLESADDLSDRHSISTIRVPSKVTVQSASAVSCERSPWTGTV